MNKKIGHKIILSIILFTLIIPNLTEAEKYEAEGWWYLSGFDGGGLLPPKFYFRLYGFGIGFAPPIGLGIGTAAAEIAGPFQEGEEIVGGGGYAPIYLYWVPYVNWREKENIFVAQPAFYLFLGFGGWTSGEDLGKNIYMKTGIGLHYSLPNIGFGAEAGIISYKAYDWEEASTSPYIGVTLSVGYSWRGIGVKKISPPSTHLPIPLAKETPTPSIPKKPKYPPDLLITNIKFTEPSGNDALDGHEKGIISFKIENKGKGEAINVRAKSVPLTTISGLQYNKITTIGDIPPNSSKEVNLEIQAEPDVSEGTAKMRIEIVEEYGFDAEPFTIAFNVKPFKPPQFIIADYGIDDDKEGDSYGDNDGIIELGEAIEITLAIQNIGEGDAKNVKAQVSIIGEGENIYYGSEKRIFDLGDIKTGSYKNLKFFFSTSKRYEKDSIPIKINISEFYGRYGKEITLKLPVNRPTGKGKEVIITEKPSEEIKEKPKPKPIKIDVDIIPENSITRLENGTCIIFGIEKYKYAPDATFANRDAVIFYEYAKKVLGIPEKNIYIRTNEDATKGEFDKIFGKDGWLKRRTNPESDIFIYFSGHGSSDAKTKKRYLIPYDIDPNYAASGVDLEEILEELSNLKVKSVTLFIDACFSGISRENKMILAGSRPIIPIEIEKIPEKVSILSSSSGNEISSSYPEMQHGLFTYYLLKGLGGEGDLDKNKRITLKELADYVRDKVSSKARELDREQTPFFKGIDRELIRLK